MTTDQKGTTMTMTCGEPHPGGPAGMLIDGLIEALDRFENALLALEQPVPNRPEMPWYEAHENQCPDPDFCPGEAVCMGWVTA